jgi:hypothetical protein
LAQNLGQDVPLENEERSFHLKPNLLELNQHWQRVEEEFNNLKEKTFRDLEFKNQVLKELEEEKKKLQQELKKEKKKLYVKKLYFQN